MFLLPWDRAGDHAEDAARSAPRLAAPTIIPEVTPRTRRDPSRPGPSGWVHQAFTPLPTEGFLALRAATSAYRKGA